MVDKCMSFAQYLELLPTSNDVLTAIESLDYQLKQYHNAGYYVSSISFNSVFLKDGDFAFSWVQKLPEENADLYKKGNMTSLFQFALGAYNYLDPASSGNVFGVKNFDYSNYNFEFIKNNYGLLRTSIPEVGNTLDYYDGFLSGNTMYLTDYMKSNNLEGNSNNRRFSKVKSTPAGKALSLMDDYNNGAFTQIFFYPILGVCLSILSITIYIILLCS